MSSPTVLFDLDGTLMDTAPDMIGALNELLISDGNPTINLASARHLVSMGSFVLIQHALGIERDHPNMPALRDRFLALYWQRMDRESRYFEGVPELLESLAERGIVWGIVTNKPAHLTHELLQRLPPAFKPQCVVCPEDVGKAKPHPEPLWHAAKLCRSDAHHCVYIGDDERDIQASQRANMQSHVAMWGYLGNGKPPEDWGSASLLTHPLHVLEPITLFKPAQP